MLIRRDIDQASQWQRPQRQMRGSQLVEIIDVTDTRRTGGLCNKWQSTGDDWRQAVTVFKLRMQLPNEAGVIDNERRRVLHRGERAALFMDLRGSQ